MSTSEPKEREFAEGEELVAYLDGELPPAECQAEVWVGEADRAQAERLLRDDAPPAGPAWTCPACGERMEPQFAQCWRCGATRRA